MVLVRTLEVLIFINMAGTRGTGLMDYFENQLISPKTKGNPPKKKKVFYKFFKRLAERFYGSSLVGQISPKIKSQIFLLPSTLQEYAGCLDERISTVSSFFSFSQCKSFKGELVLWMGGVCGIMRLSEFDRHQETSKIDWFFS